MIKLESSTIVVGGWLRDEIDHERERERVRPIQQHPTDSFSNAIYLPMPQHHITQWHRSRLYK